MRSIVWFRGKDLRIGDHAPLREAAKAGDVIPLFVLDPYFFAKERAGAFPHRIQFLLASLDALAKNLESRGTRLVVVPGKSVDVVPRLVHEWKADRVLAHRWTEPFGRERDRRIAAALGPRFQLFEGETLLPPESIRNGAGEPYSVFTPFARQVRSLGLALEPVPAPRMLPSLPRGLRAEEAAIPTCKDLGLEENPRILPGGERAAHARLKAFLEVPVRDYPVARDRMDRAAGTSRLSADLKFGTVSVRRVWSAVEHATAAGEGARVFENELLWREFAYSTLWDRPQVLQEPFNAAFRDFPYLEDAASWDAWVSGNTGYPVVDAAARQLLEEGFVHNRARMISASFLTKHLLTSYTRGEAHYMKFLTDGDYASNNLGWQWSAGCGCDAQPYFRIFNPVSQGEKFDPEGEYVKRFVPELALLPARFVHAPWMAPEAILRDAGVVLGKTYPLPVVEHRFARERFLETARRRLRR